MPGTQQSQPQGKGTLARFLQPKPQPKPAQESSSEPSSAAVVACLLEGCPFTADTEQAVAAHMNDAHFSATEADAAAKPVSAPTPAKPKVSLLAFCGAKAPSHNPKQPNTGSVGNKITGAATSAGTARHTQDDGSGGAPKRAKLDSTSETSHTATVPVCAANADPSTSKCRDSTSGIAPDKDALSAADSSSSTVGGMVGDETGARVEADQPHPKPPPRTGPQTQR